MDSLMLIDKAREALSHFNAAEYPGAFSEFEKACLPFFDRLSDPELDARELLLLMEKRRESMGKREKEKLLGQEKLALALYLSPAADRRGGPAAEFAESLKTQWNDLHPRNRFFCGSYENILQGFEASFLGIPLKNFIRRK